jgi:hypothetical protein
MRGMRAGPPPCWMFQVSSRMGWPRVADDRLAVALDSLVHGNDFYWLEGRRCGGEGVPKPAG